MSSISASAGAPTAHPRTRERPERARPAPRAQPRAPARHSHSIPAARPSTARASLRNSLRERATSSLSSAGAALRRGSHHLRKRAARAITSDASLEAGLRESFVGKRRRLERLSRALADGLALRDAGARGWREILTARQEVARAIVSASAGTGCVRAAADALRVGTGEARTGAERTIKVDDTRAHAEEAGVRMFQTEVEGVLKECALVDVEFCEVRRIRNKLERLERSARTKSEKLDSNRRKLDLATGKFAKRINGAEGMADKTLAKRDLFLGALLRAFWRTEQSFEGPLSQGFQEFHQAIARCPMVDVAVAMDRADTD